MIGKVIGVFREKNLRARVARGGMWLGGATVMDQGARFLRNVILARVLAPADFGMMFTVAATTSAFDAFMEVGVRLCVIQSERGGEEGFLNAAWWFSAGRGTMLYAAGFLAAPLVSYFYKSAEFTPLLRVAFLALLLQGLVSPRMHTLEKGLDFRRWIMVTQGSGIIAVAATIGAAFWLRSVWALVLGIVLDASLRLVLSQVVCGLVPRRPVDRECFREITRFARGMFGLPILMMFFAQGPVLYLRWVYPDAEVGKYGLAATLAMVPQLVFNGAVLPLMLPTFAGFKDQPERLKQAVLDAVKSVIILAAPVTAFIVVFSEALVEIAYGPNYAGLGTVLSLLAVGTLAMIVNAVVVSAFVALGMPALHRKYSFWRVVILAAAIAPLVKWAGIAGAPMALLAALLGVFFVQQQRLDRLIGIPGKEVLVKAAQGLAGGAFVFVLFAAVKAIVTRPASVTVWGRAFTFDGAHMAMGIGAVILAAMLAVGASRILTIRTAGK